MVNKCYDCDKILTDKELNDNFKENIEDGMLLCPKCLKKFKEFQKELDK